MGVECISVSSLNTDAPCLHTNCLQIAAPTCGVFLRLIIIFHFIHTVFEHLSYLIFTTKMLLAEVDPLEKVTLPLIRAFILSAWHILGPCLILEVLCPKDV